MSALDPGMAPANDRTSAGAVILRAEGLERRFGGLHAVAGFSFELRAGEILGLIGPNGAGKSTTFNMLSGFLRPSAGRLWFRGQEITGLSAKQISRMGLIRTFQHDSILARMSVRDNLLVAASHSVRGHAARMARVEEVAGITDLAPYLDVMAGSLPHGRQRMLSVAIALACGPTLLCLDEPLTGLQGAEVAAALDLFETIRSQHGIPILLVEHNMRAVMRICDRIVVLDHGRLLAEGTPAEVSRNEAVIAAYLGGAR